MGKYLIFESVGSGRQRVHAYDDLEIHHPSQKGREPGRVYADVEGEREEVLRTRTASGHLMVSKDLILVDSESKSSRVVVPSPIAGYLGQVDERNGLVEIYDRPGGELLLKIRHMDLRQSSLKEGDWVEYGQPLGIQCGFGGGNPHRYPTHVHIDFNQQFLGQLNRYLVDMDSGAIAPAPIELVDGVLSTGDYGPAVTHLQQQLLRLGHAAADGRPLSPDGDFGRRTREAVEAFQRAHDLPANGIAGPETLEAVARASARLLGDARHPHHALYTQARTALQATDHPTHANTDNLAAALTLAALHAGLTRIDRVELNDTGTLARAVQASPLRDEPGLNQYTGPIDIAHARQQPLHASSEHARVFRQDAQALPLPPPPPQILPSPAHAPLAT